MKRLYETLKDDFEKWNSEEYVYEKINGEVHSYTFGNFIAGVCDIAKSLIDKGYKDQYIIIFGDNSCKLMQVDLASLVYVGKSVVVSKEWKEDDLSYAIERLEAPVLLYGREKEEIVKGLKDKYNIDFICFDDFKEEGNNCFNYDLPHNNYEECCKIVFSSGTTGKPKGVMLSEKNILAGYNSLIRRCPFDHTDSTYVFLPLNHTYGNIYNFIYSLIAGYKVYLSSGTTEISKELLEYNPTIFCMVPKVAEKMLEGYGDNISIAFGKNIKYIFCGGAALDRSIRQKYKDAGLNMMQAYALSETASSFAIAYPYSDDLESAGTIFEDLEVKIFEPDENGVGEIIAKGDAVFLGYANDEETTKKVFDDKGYFHTGDLGCIKDNKLFIKGRKKRMLLTYNGENVSPEDVEEKLEQNEYIKKATLYQKGNKICANLYVEDFDVDYNRIIDAFNESVPKYQRIDEFEVLKNSIENRLKQ